MDKETNGHLYIANDNLKRIADALEEILRMVKTDQERAEEARIHYKMEEEQTKWVEDKGPKVFGPWLTTGAG